MVIVDEVGRHTMEVLDKSKTEGIRAVLTAVPDTPEARGAKAALETGKASP